MQQRPPATNWWREVFVIVDATPILFPCTIMPDMPTADELEWMLWRVEEGQQEESPAANLIQAIQHYVDKYGQVPNRCEVAPEWEDNLIAPSGIAVEISKKVRRDHLLLTFDFSFDAVDGVEKMIGRGKTKNHHQNTG